MQDICGWASVSAFFVSIQTYLLKNKQEDFNPRKHMALKCFISYNSTGQHLMLNDTEH